MTAASKPRSGKTLVALIGAAAAALLTPLLVKHEGTVFRGYVDAVGVPTKCTGDTQDVVVGRTYTPAECAASLERQQIAHAEPVLACVPALRGHPHQLAAAISLAYNIGAKKFCGSTVARRFKARDWRGACDAFLAWNRAGGNVLPGLVRRREDERRLCLQELPA